MSVLALGYDFTCYTELDEPAKRRLRALAILKLSSKILLLYLNTDATELKLFHSVEKKIECENVLLPNCQSRWFNW